MKSNESTLDRIIRMIIAIVLGVMVLSGAVSGTWAIILAVVALALFVTGIVGMCWLYSACKISTHKKTV